MFWRSRRRCSGDVISAAQHARTPGSSHAPWAGARSCVYSDSASGYKSVEDEPAPALPRASAVTHGESFVLLWVDAICLVRLSGRMLHRSGGAGRFALSCVPPPAPDAGTRPPPPTPYLREIITLPSHQLPPPERLYAQTSPSRLAAKSSTTTSPYHQRLCLDITASVSQASLQPRPLMPHLHRLRARQRLPT